MGHSTRTDHGDDRWRRALSRAKLGVWDVDIEAGCCTYSATWKEMLGYGDDELPDDDPDLWLSLVHPDDRAEAIASGERHLAGETPDIETEFRMRHKSGRWIWVIDRGGVIERDADGKPTRMLGVQANITRRKKMERTLERANQRLRLALDASGVGSWQFELKSGKLFWDARMREIFGLESGSSIVPRSAWHDRLHPDDKERVETATESSFESKSVVRLRYRIVRPDQEIRHVETLTKYVTDAKASDWLVGVTRDVTEDVLSGQALAAQKERLRVTLQSISDAVISTDCRGRIDFANASAQTLLARSEQELLGMSLAEAFNCDRDEDIASGETRTFLRRCGAEHSLRCTSSPIKAPDGTGYGTVYTFQDVTGEQRRQTELAHAARHDSLTGLLNRTAFAELLDDCIRDAGSQPFALAYIDLDHFKALNDFAGHAAGDAALKKIASSVMSSLPRSTVMARLGGDEFAVIAPASGTRQAEVIAESILEAFQRVEYDHHIRDRRLGASVGVVIATDDVIGGTDLLAMADDACYAAKAGGRNRFVVNCERSHRGLTAIQMVSDVADAMEQGRLKLYGQEIRSLDQPWRFGSKIEVLARLIDKYGNLVPPGEFIPAAERFGMAPVLDRWIIRHALRRYGHALNAAGGLALGFNLSAQTLSDPDLWEFVRDTIAETDASPSNVVFEITETAAVTNFEAAEAFVRAARKNGFRVSLDDFGAGLSSFGYLRRFPVDSIKIDGSFIQNIANNEFDRAIVASISGIAKNIGFDLIAEKIEDPAAIPILQSLGVKFGQGFLLHQPEPLGSVLEARQRNEARQII